MEDISDDSVGFDTESEEGEIKTDDSENGVNLNMNGEGFKIIDECHSESDFEDELQLRYQALKSAYIRRLNEIYEKTDNAYQPPKINADKDVDDRTIYYSAKNLFSDIDERADLFNNCTNFNDIDERKIVCPSQRKTLQNLNSVFIHKKENNLHRRNQRIKYSKNFQTRRKKKSGENKKVMSKSKTISKQKLSKGINLDKKNAILKKLASSKVVLNSNSIGHEILKAGEKTDKCNNSQLDIRKSQVQMELNTKDTLLNSVYYDALCVDEISTYDFENQYKTLYHSKVSKDSVTAKPEFQSKKLTPNDKVVNLHIPISDNKENIAESNIQQETKINLVDYVRLDEPMDIQSESEGDIESSNHLKTALSDKHFSMNVTANSIELNSDEDEELLRAKLLIEIAQRQNNISAPNEAESKEVTNSIPHKVTVVVQNNSDSNLITDKNKRSVHYTSLTNQNNNYEAHLPCPNFLTNRKVTHIRNITNAIPHERLVISLKDSEEEDSANDESCEQNIKKLTFTSSISILQDQVSNFLKSARKASDIQMSSPVAPKKSSMNAISCLKDTPQAICHLPKVKQQEYQILKKQLAEKVSKHLAKKKAQCISQLQYQANKNTFQQSAEKFSSYEKIKNEFKKVDNVFIRNDVNSDIKESSDNKSTLDQKKLHESSKTETVARMPEKIREECGSKKRKYHNVLQILEKKIKKQRGALEMNLSNISILLDQVGQEQEDIKTLQSKIKEQKKYLQELESILLQKKGKITQRNAIIKKKFNEVQVSRLTLGKLESRCIHIGSFLFGNSYLLPQMHRKDPLPNQTVSKYLLPKNSLCIESEKCSPAAEEFNSCFQSAVSSIILNNPYNDNNTDSPKLDGQQYANISDENTNITSKTNACQDSSTTSTDYHLSSLPYYSPLDHLHFKSSIDPHKILCRYALLGTCQDKNCSFQHHLDLIKPS